ncbi:MAG: hypothetical protein IRZ26_01985 [Clostridia bacterium]|nr:hypothetical protein [Clostridia bacterium]
MADLKPAQGLRVLLKARCDRIKDRRQPLGGGRLALQSLGDSRREAVRAVPRWRPALGHLQRDQHESDCEYAGQAGGTRRGDQLGDVGHQDITPAYIW